MKRLVIILACIGTVIMTSEAKSKIQVVISDDLVHSICQVESGNNPNAVGDNGKSFGIAQIQKICVDDVNRILRLKKSEKRFNYEDRKSVSKSQEMMKIYVEFYGRQYAKETGMKPTDKVLSRIWNGGPHGWKLDATYAYYQRVRKYLVA